MRKYDLIVVGAGISSGSLIYNLLKLGFKGSILVVDRGDKIASGPTAFSAGGFRNLWTTDINQKLCSYSIELLKNFTQEMGVGCAYQGSGYLFTYYQKAWDKMPAAFEQWKANGVNFEVLEPRDIENKIPGLLCGIDHMDPEIVQALGFEPIVGGVFGKDCGSFDPSQAAVGYFERALTDYANPPVIELNTEVLSVRIENGVATGVILKTPEGLEESVSGGMVALCTGPWINQLLKRSGMSQEDLTPVIAQKRMMFITEFPGSPNVDPRWKEIPLTIIDQGIYFKYESGNLMIGKARQDEPDSFDTTLEQDYYINEVNLPMQERIPSASSCKLKSGWGGLYDTNSLDHNAIVGWHDNYKNLLLQVGYSGHGAMESPAVGLCLAELIFFGAYRTIDCSPLRWSRFREGKLVKETIVI